VFDNEGATYQVNWIDNNRLIYTRKDGGVGIFYIGFNDLIDINLAAGLDGEVFILR
jgi:hypothetical protein